jgi:hypothetical protein
MRFPRLFGLTALASAPLALLGCYLFESQAQKPLRSLEGRTLRKLPL